MAVRLAKPSDPLPGISPLLKVHAKNLLWDGDLELEVLTDAEALRDLVWDEALYEDLLKGQPCLGGATYRVANAIGYMRVHVFSKQNGDHTPSIQALAEIGIRYGSTRTLRHPRIGYPKLVEFANILADMEASANQRNAAIQEVVVNVSRNLAGRVGTFTNPQITMLLHYLAQNIFELGIEPDPSKTVASFPNLKTALYTLSNPEWESGRRIWEPRESLVQSINRSIVARGGADVEGTNPRPVYIGAALIGDKAQDRALERAVDWMCVLLVERARRAAGSRNGLRRARKLAVKDTRAGRLLIPDRSIVDLFWWLIHRILKPMFIGFLTRFDAQVPIRILRGGRRKFAVRAGMSLLEMTAVRDNLLDLAFQAKRMVAVQRAAKQSEASLPHRLIAEDQGQGTYVLLVTHDRSVDLKDRLWRRKDKNQWHSMNGQAYTMMERQSEDELMRMTRNSDGKVLSARARAFAQHIGENVLMVVYN